MQNRILLILAFVVISTTAALTPSIAKADILVYDNNNQNLGILVKMEYGDTAWFIPSLGGVFQYSTDYTGWCGDEIRVVFQSGDCSGTPYSVDPWPEIYDFSPTPISGFYKVDYNGKQTFTPGSYYDFGCGCSTIPGQYPLAEYYPYVEVQLPFTTPVALPLKFKVRTKTIVVPLSD